MSTDESTNKEVLPCPFCGKPGIIHDWGSIVEMRCNECGVYGPSGSTRQEAIRKWNRRASLGAGEGEKVHNTLKVERRYP